MKKGLMILAVLMMFAISGCGSLEISLQEDGSGSAAYVIPQNELMSKEAVLGQIKSQIEEENEQAGKDIMKLNSVDEKDGTIKARIQFTPDFWGAELTQENYFATVQDIQRVEPSLLEDLISVKDRKSLKEEEIKNIIGNPAIYYGDLDESMETTITVPGKVLFVSGDDTVDKNQVSVNGSEVFIVYETSSSSPIGMIIFIAFLAVAGLLGYKYRAYLIALKEAFLPNKKLQPEGDINA